MNIFKQKKLRCPRHSVVLYNQKTVKGTVVSEVCK